MKVKVFQIVKETGFAVSVIGYDNISEIAFKDNAFVLYPEKETDDIIEYPIIGEYFNFSYIIEEV